NKANRHAGKAEEEHGMGDAIDGIQRRQPIERRTPGVFADLHLSLDAALLREVEDGGDQAETERGRGGKQCGYVGDEPIGTRSLRREGVAGEAQRGDKDQEKRNWQGKDSE